MLEELPLRSVGEAVELERVLADVGVDLERDLPRVGPPRRTRRRGDEVADPVHVEDETVGTVGNRRPAQPRDHDATTFISGGASAWQIATASASEACVDAGGERSPRIVRTIRATWAFSARP